MLSTSSGLIPDDSPLYRALARYLGLGVIIIVDTVVGCTWMGLAGLST